MKKQSMICSII